MMIRVCAWCPTVSNRLPVVLPAQPGDENEEGTSHGVCPECYDKVLEQAKGGN